MDTNKGTMCAKRDQEEEEFATARPNDDLNDDAKTGAIEGGHRSK
jgi:hypothetical protein